MAASELVAPWAPDNFSSEEALGPSPGPYCLFSSYAKLPVPNPDLPLEIILAIGAVADTAAQFALTLASRGLRDEFLHTLCLPAIRMTRPWEKVGGTYHPAHYSRDRYWMYAQWEGAASEPITERRLGLLAPHFDINKCGGFGFVPRRAKMEMLLRHGFRLTPAMFNAEGSLQGWKLLESLGARPDHTFQPQKLKITTWNFFAHLRVRVPLSLDTILHASQRVLREFVRRQPAAGFAYVRARPPPPGGDAAWPPLPGGANWQCAHYTLDAMLAHAVENGLHARIAGALLALGASPNVRLADGGTPIFTCDSGDYVSRGLAHMLLKHGADMNARDAAGNTAMHVNQKACLVRVYIAGGVDPTIRNAAGLTALDIVSGRPGLAVAAERLREYDAAYRAKKGRGPAPALD